MEKETVMQAAAVSSDGVHPLIAGRWSPYAFADRPVSGEDLRALFEAARLAPSSFNEQPWRFLVARREDGDAFARLLEGLVEGNRIWARHAPVLAVAMAGLRLQRNGSPNRLALHDVGLAAAALSFEAVARGLQAHMMGGILPERLRELHSLPDGWEPITAIAVGYPGERTDLPADLTARDARRRPRRSLGEIVFTGAWGRSAGWAASPRDPEVSAGAS